MPAPETYVAVSRITVPPEGAALEAAFADRLGEVDAWPGFQRLEVWRDPKDPSQYLMVSWWDDEESFKAYLRSDAHRRSHARMSGEPWPPRPAGLSTYELIAT